MDSSREDDEEARRQWLLDSIPRFEDIEKHKENILPRRQGRSAAALVSLYGPEPQERDQMLRERHDEFERELEQLNELDDPLDVYVRYIRWTLEMYPQGHNQDSNLVGLLKDATARFQDEDCYRSDIRYLNCWLQYAKWVEDPKDIYVFLMKKDIGQLWAAFYEEYATYYERRKKYSEAGEVFDLGVSRNARPVERLKRTRDGFKARVQQRRERGMIEEEDHTREQMQSLQRTGQRTMLGHKHHSSSRFSVPVNIFNNEEGINRTARPGHFGNASPSSTPKPSNSRFKVYSDAESSAPEPFSSVLPPSSSSRNSASFPRAPPTYRKKENEHKVATFAGTMLPQKAHQTPSVSKFEVFRDESGTGEPDEAAERAEPLLKISKGEHTAAQLRKKPLLDISTSGSVPYLRRTPDTPSQTALETWFNRMKPYLISSSDSAGKPEYIAAHKDCLGNGTDGPLSFEELRARQYLRSEDKDPGTPPPSAGFDFEACKPRASSPTVELTAETRAAMESIGALFSKSGKGKERATSDIEEEDEPLLDWDRMVPARRTHRHNENEVEKVATLMNADRRERRPFMSVLHDKTPFFDQEDKGTDDNDANEMQRDLAAEAEEVQARQTAKKRGFDVFRDD